MSVALHKVFAGFPENAFLYKTCRMWRLSTVFSYFEFLAFVCLFVFFFSYPLLSHPSPLCVQWVTNVATATRYNTPTRTAVLDYIITHWFPQYTLHFSLSLDALLTVMPDFLIIAGLWNFAKKTLRLILEVVHSS